MGILLLIIFEIFVFHAIWMRNRAKANWFKWLLFGAYIGITLFGYFMPFYYRNQGNSAMGTYPNTLVFVPFVLWFVFKFLFFLVIVSSDVVKAFKWLFKAVFKLKKDKKESAVSTLPLLSRSKFLVRSATLVAATPVAALSFGITSGAHDYRIRRKEVAIKGLPKSFDGLRLLQLSDIHSGSFWNKTAVEGGIEMAMAEKPDLICFTGDLVNSAASEMNNYINVFNKLKADMGVYSIIGNHDYGNYVHWNSPQDKNQNFADLLKVHDNLGWNLMLNENKVFTQGGEKLALIGVENWSNNARFPSTGDLKKALVGTEGIASKILLSHDPTHWRGQVLEQNPTIALTLSGHTHGMQFGVETENFKWSPVQYLYKEWAGLYQEKEQQLYVNRGFGYLGYPGRFGILPEITVLTLKAV